ncbi:MAG: hypothetical protein LC676_19270 [Loktanella sp.]|nr:hypothetical protein [Loktanella sp.]
MGQKESVRVPRMKAVDNGVVDNLEKAIAALDTHWMDMHLVFSFYESGKNFRKIDIFSSSFKQPANIDCDRHEIAKDNIP